MTPLEKVVDEESVNWEYLTEKVTVKDDLVSKFSVKGSQFAQPYLEFSGACAGCGETPYAKVITQLYGERMVIANATGCSSIWGASAPSTPYCTNDKGQGPAWANSLFEDNAEYGYGMLLGINQIRDRIVRMLEELLTLDTPQDAKEAAEYWLANRDDAGLSKRGKEMILAAFDIASVSGRVKQVFARVLERDDALVKKSLWIVGGDGWAYDIGYGGLDHVLASGDDVNVLVFDTEVYSNTGGQSSKATPTAAVAKFAASGKKVKKKDLGLMQTTYGYVYVAQVAMGANKNQFLKAVAEAEAYPGPSLIIAYSPCINHGIKEGMGRSQNRSKEAVESGYWHLYRYNPTLKKEGKNPFTLDSKEPTKSFQDFLAGEVRYTSLTKSFPDVAEELFVKAEESAKERYESYKNMADK
jgi:pyruvate-ferredoxin/flavodoxin oxidoreductase